MHEDPQDEQKSQECQPVVSWVVLLAFLVTAVLPLPALAGDAVFYYHNDPTGSPVAITNAAGTKVWGADYEPFGEIAGLVENVPNNQQFLAKPVDPETSLHLLGARYYDGKLGRFLSIDPELLDGAPRSTITFPQRLNCFSNAANNPFRFADPSGRFPYALTAWNFLSYSLSLHAFSQDPSILNAIALGVDGVALVTGTVGGAGVAVKAAGGLEKAADVGGAVSRVSQKLPDSPIIDPKSIAGKSPIEIDSIAKQNGLISKGSDPMSGAGSYIDPVTGKQRVLVHPNDPKCGPHCHVNDPNGKRLDINGKEVLPDTPEAHLPLAFP